MVVIPELFWGGDDQKEIKPIWRRRVSWRNFSWGKYSSSHSKPISAVFTFFSFFIFIGTLVKPERISNPI